MNSRKKIEMQQKRLTILSVSKALFIEKGYFNASADEISKAAGVSKGSLYSYFDSKEEILTHLILQSLDELENLIVELIDNESFSVNDFWEVPYSFLENSLKEIEILKIIHILDLTSDRKDLINVNDKLIKIKSIISSKELPINKSFFKKAIQNIGEINGEIIFNEILCDILQGNQDRKHLINKYKSLEKIIY